MGDRPGGMFQMLGARPQRRALSAFTFVELLVVIAVLVVLGGIAAMRAGDMMNDARMTTCRASLTAVRNAMIGDAERPGFRADLGRIPDKAVDLFIIPAGAAAFDPYSATGWDGPYLSAANGKYTINDAKGFGADYGANGDPAVLDAWGAPIVLQRPPIILFAGADAAAQQEQFTRLVSAGPDGVVQTPLSAKAPDLNDPAQVGDDVVLYLFRANGP